MNKKTQLASLIKPLKLDRVKSDITEEHFPVQPEDSDSPKEYKVFNFGSVSSENAEAQMEKEGFRPATLREMLMWAAKNWDRKSWIVALGSRWRDPGGDVRIAVLIRDGDECRLILCWLRVDWIGSYSFLGVRKSDSDSRKLESSQSLGNLESRVRELEAFRRKDMDNSMDLVFSALLSGDQTAEIFLREGTDEQKVAAKKYIEVKKKILEFYF